MAEYAKMAAAATMIIHSGERVARYTPTGDVSAPPRPAARPSQGRQVRLRKWETAPETDVNTMAIMEVAVQAMAGNP